MGRQNKAELGSKEQRRRKINFNDAEKGTSAGQDSNGAAPEKKCHNSSNNASSLNSTEAT